MNASRTNSVHFTPAPNSYEMDIYNVVYYQEQQGYNASQINLTTSTEIKFIKLIGERKMEFGNWRRWTQLEALHR